MFLCQNRNCLYRWAMIPVAVKKVYTKHKIIFILCFRRCINGLITKSGLLQFPGSRLLHRNTISPAIVTPSKKNFQPQSEIIYHPTFIIYYSTCMGAFKIVASIGCLKSREHVIAREERPKRSLAY